MMAPQLSATDLPPISAATVINEAKAHLGAAIVQMLDTDDLIICNHVKAALELLRLIRCEQ
jgi:hypothetical protein